MEKILLKFLRDNEGTWFKKVQLYVLADQEGYSPETCGRTLRDLSNREMINVDYYNGKYAKNLAKYAYKPIKPILKEVIINGERRMQYVN